MSDSRESPQAAPAPPQQARAALSTRPELSDAEIDAFIPAPVLRDERGRGFGGEGSWARFQVQAAVRAALAARGEKR